MTTQEVYDLALEQAVDVAEHCTCDPREVTRQVIHEFLSALAEHGHKITPRTIDEQVTRAVHYGSHMAKQEAWALQWDAIEGPVL
jgi:hypothetical protein